MLIASHELELVRPFATREVVLTNGQAHGALPAEPEPAAAREPVETNP